MSEDKDSPQPGTSDEGAGAAGAADANNSKTDDGKKDEGYSPEEIERIKKSRDDAKAAKRRTDDELKAIRDKHEADLKELETLKKERDAAARLREQEEAAKNGDIDKLRASAKAREAEQQAEIDRISSQAKADLEEAKRIRAEAEDSILKAKAYSVLSQLTIDPDVAYTLLRERMKLSDGEVVLKDDVRDFAKFVEQHFEESGKTYLLKTQRKAGSGAPADPAAAPKPVPQGVVTREQLAKMPDGGRDYLMKNPEAARELLKRK